MSCKRECDRCEKEFCTEVYREASRYCNRSEKGKQRQKDYAKRKRDEARQKGLCIICRKKMATHGSKCYECYIRQKRYDRMKNTGERERWKREGKCYFCGAEVVEGKKTCPRHYKILTQNIDKANQSENTMIEREKRKNEMQILWKGNRHTEI